MAKPSKSFKYRAYVDVSDMDLEDRVVRVDRTRKTVKGGRIPSSRATVVVGDGRGHVGIGVGKARQAPDAIRKAIDVAKKHVIRVPLDGCTVPHEIIGRCGGATVFLKPASRGTGIIAGGGVRPVMELAGIRDILSKSLGSSNTLNRAKAAFYALSELKNPHEVAKIRGKTVAQMVGREVIDDYAVVQESRTEEEPEPAEALFANSE